MKIFVAGATGRVATELLKKLVLRGHSVTAGARRVSAVAEIAGVVAVKLDLHASVEDLTKLINEHDAIIFTAGSRGKDLLQTDAFGAVKLMQAAKMAGVSRFVMLSSLYSLTPEKWPENLMDYQIAKYFADNYLITQSELDYTVIQPGPLMEELGTGCISLGDQGFTSIPIPDVAEVLAVVVDTGSTYHEVIQINPGATAINEVFER